MRNMPVFVCAYRNREENIALFCLKCSMQVQCIAFSMKGSEWLSCALTTTSFSLIAAGMLAMPCL